MHPETHLVLHHLRSAELRGRADDFRLAHHAAPRPALRSRLGWTLIEMGLRLIPAGATVPQRAPRAA
ncbi:hypothetical protein [Streptomyces sp. ITFR-16]|uniref:hypothetical protein n=1 Tax=Streptomyces sp. ITFR-16 TaxID=3075198 RepID=UPI002889C331|nr:hypothetical protein [Streptomyces sp. ITFR-16]WNI24524.1 hypothetical protein RLT58_22660 [Streptomyces sp. ITFR-16]